VFDILNRSLSAAPRKPSRFLALTAFLVVCSLSLACGGDDKEPEGTKADDQWDVMSWDDGVWS
jgi:hypothetical protein